ncbi:MAG: transglutaminase [Betaproteobacteria bacterium HGW-Betaproteobacteria-2]|nr:MAG: transglutaminase [Betaproteobacteria bacterium HGW-Betaproteobacteria-2]
MIKSLIINTIPRYRALLCTSICFFAFFFAFSLPGHSNAAINFDRLLSLAAQQYGARGQQNITDLRSLLSQLQGATDQEKLNRINMFVNQKIRIFGNDIDIWGQSDYWATPLESLGREAGDCEDFSIAKYMFLRELGISNDKLRLTYVRAQIGGPNSRIFQAHMVLSYYETPNAEPLILDNLISDIRGASRRTDLKPIFGFNSNGLWVGSSSSSRGDSSTHLSRWRDLLERARNEGIE